jgi:hypothetical protein
LTFVSQWESGGWVVHGLKRIAKATIMASGVTLGSIPILVFFHIFAPLLAPLVGGYWVGSRYHLSDAEAFLLGCSAATAVGLPLLLIQHEFGFFSYLTTLAIIYFTLIFAVYTGALISIFAWIGSHAASSDVA